MRIQLWFLFSLLCLTGLFSSCSSAGDEIPADIISKDKMIDILIDIHIAEADIQSNNLHNSDSSRIAEYGYYNHIFKKHQVTSSGFKKSFQYYATHLDILNKMYDEVIAGLSQIEAESGAAAKKIKPAGN